jgi:hypothetical protein
MNLKKELVKTFKSLLGVYFAEVLTYDSVRISDKSVGSKVQKVNSQNELEDLADGDYTMDDGFAFTVKDGLISSIVGVEDEIMSEDEVPSTGSTESVVTEPQTEEEMAKKEDEYIKKEDMSAYEDRLKAIEDTLLAVTEMVNKIKEDKSVEQFSKVVSDLNENIKTLAKVPVQFSKTTKEQAVTEDNGDKLFDLAKIIGTMNKK